MFAFPLAMGLSTRTPDLDSSRHRSPAERCAISNVVAVHAHRRHDIPGNYLRES
jgi:hypothetical protein